MFTIFVYENGNYTRFERGHFTKKECDILGLPLQENEVISAWKRKTNSQNSVPLFTRPLTLPFYKEGDAPHFLMEREKLVAWGFPRSHQETPCAFRFSHHGELTRLYNREGHSYFDKPRFKNPSQLINIPVTWLCKKEARLAGITLPSNTEPAGYRITLRGNVVPLYDLTNLCKLHRIISQDDPLFNYGFLSEKDADTLFVPKQPKEEPIYTLCVRLFGITHRIFIPLYDRRNDPRWRLRLLTDTSYNPVYDYYLKRKPF